MKRIRNFSIIAHIDHGKSTLADRILERTGTISAREMEDQVLDQMDLERERGITIKARAVKIDYQAKDGNQYILNLIDTPGHVDFTYEVSRSLAACEGVLLVIDASQGIEAQTLANFYLALGNDLEIIPVINKIDLPNADAVRVKHQIEDVLGLDASGSILTSAKEGIGTVDVLEGVVTRIPPPKGSADAPLKALIFDSFFDPYHGAVIVCRLYDGGVRKGTKIKLWSSGKVYEVDQVGVFRPKLLPQDELIAGEVGYIFAGIKQIKDAKVGDTVTDADNPAEVPLPGYKEPKSMVFSGLYPADGANYETLKDSLEKLSLNDSSFVYEPETSDSLGFGFRCGFLGLLHMDIVKERLEREFGLSLIVTAPTVAYSVRKTSGETFMVRNPSRMPPANQIDRIEEPYISATIMVPEEYLGNILKLAQERRGVYKGMEYLDTRNVILRYNMPLNEIVFDFYDKLKSASKGYASLDYEFSDFRPSELVKLDMLLNGTPVDSLSLIIHKDRAYTKGRDLVQKMRQIIPRQLFEVAIQAAIGNRVIARETVRPLRKNVTAKCYGGDITRKRKLLEKQKEGKKRMKQLGHVSVPQEAFIALLKVD